MPTRRLPGGTWCTEPVCHQLTGSGFRNGTSFEWNDFIAPPVRESPRSHWARGTTRRVDDERTSTTQTAETGGDRRPGRGNIDARTSTPQTGGHRRAHTDGRRDQTGGRNADAAGHRWRRWDQHRNGTLGTVIFLPISPDTFTHTRRFPNPNQLHIVGYCLMVRGN